MIEKLFKNDESRKKWYAFKNKKVSYYSLITIFVMCFFSFTAEFWANSKPLYLNYNGNTFFPVFVDYSAKDFGIKDAIVVDYKKLKLEDGDSVIWPIIKWDPYESNKKVDTYPAPPSNTNIMGTDDRGRDVFTRLLYGLRYSIIFAVFVWLITFIVGALVGSFQGFMGGWIDLIGQRVTEILSSVPQLFLLIILVAVFEPNLFFLIIILSLFGWIPISYYMRAEFLKNRKLDYVEAARSLGASRTSIFFKHILPNSLSPIITFSPFAIVGNISALAALDYLGFGLVPPTPSWGELLAQAQNNFVIAWWIALWTFLALMTVLILLSLVGDGVRDVMDPKKRDS
jgi:microcin C transport system permease protein